MNTELFTEYIEVLTDSSSPGSRVTRKVAALTVLAIFILVYYRHVVLEFGLWEPFFVTVGLAFLCIVLLGIFGGLGAGALYENYLRKAGSKNPESSIVVFFVELLFAATAPIIGLLIYVLIGGSYEFM